MALEARCRSDSGRLRSCLHRNRPECRCRRPVRSPNAANPATSSRALFGHADGCWIVGAAAAVFFSGWFRGQGNVRHGGAVRRHRLRARFGFQKSSIWSRRHQKIAAVDHAQEFRTQVKHGFCSCSVTRPPTVQPVDTAQLFALWFPE